MQSKVCGRCRGIGWLVELRDGIETAAPCPGCQGDRRLQERLKAAQIPPRYFDRGFDVYSIHHPSQERALKKAIEFVESFPEAKRGLLFLGTCGVGKTHLSVALLKTIVQENDISGRFVDEAELLRRLQYSYGPESPDTERDVLLPLMNVDLLVWDDLGTGRPTDWVRETVRMVINHRYTYRKQTIISSNWPLKSRNAGGSVEQTLPERIGSRLFSRIMEMCEIVQIDGPDARTEIHKAGMDFSSAHQPDLRLPTGLIECPRCESKQVRILDQASRSGGCSELSCLCEQCSEHFLARFFPRTARLEYPAQSDD